ncbi:MAG: hypothetical protein RLZZ341_2105, partial [Pseudomonadota bacterium]
MRLAAAAAAFLLALSPLALAADAAPRIGLVLGGGGARGAAHIGVLEELERLRVPVHCVAGTSMGALVAGAWVAGRSPAEMRAAMQAADWNEMFMDGAGDGELDLRARRLRQRFLPGSETGIVDGGAVAPPALVQGQRIKFFLNALVRAETGEPLIERLPLPLSIIATDIGTGERVVMRDGPLTEAMRSSMAVPGLLAPFTWRGRKLVDGGLVDNVPVRELRERCGADVVIAVNVGSPPLPAESIAGVLSITAQMVALLTEQNVGASLALLTPRDVLIRPDLGTITAADFARGRFLVARVDAIEVVGLVRVAPEVLLRHVRQRTGAPLDATTLATDLERAYGDGHYERLDYTVSREGGRTVLRLLPVEKAWGPDYLRVGLQLQSTLNQGSTYQLRAALQRTWLNPLGAELLLAAELGSVTGVKAEFMQPLLPSQRVFVDAVAEYRRERSDYFFLEQRIAEYRTVEKRLHELGLHARDAAELGRQQQLCAQGVEPGALQRRAQLIGRALV